MDSWFWFLMFTCVGPTSMPWLNLPIAASTSIEKSSVKGKNTDRDHYFLFYTCILYNQWHSAVTVPGSGIKHEISCDFCLLSCLRHMCANFEQLFRSDQTCDCKSDTAYIRCDHFYWAWRSPIFEKTCVDFLKGRNVCAIRLFTYRWRPFVVAASTSEVSRAPFYAYLLKEVEPVIPGRVVGASDVVSEYVLSGESHGTVRSQ